MGPQVQVGFDQYTIKDRGLAPAELLEFARRHRLDGVQFLDPAQIDQGLELRRLEDFGRLAESTGLYLETGIPSPNPIRRSRELERSVSPRERAAELEPYLDAVVALGCRVARVYVGDRHDRFRSDFPWSAQLAATEEVFSLLTPRLRARGLQLAIETHADLTLSELVQLLDRLDPEGFGVTLDTGNLAMRLDDPLEACMQLAPRVLMTHIKDAVLSFTPRGLCWQARPVGSGMLPMPDLLAVLIQAQPGIRLSIELHPRTYDLPIYDRKWLAYFPDLTPASLAAVVRLAAQCEVEYARGTLPTPAEVESVPWEERDLEWLASSLGYLRSVVSTLATI
jgi:sugar phosphate isomerase/epimerase